MSVMLRFIVCLIMGGIIALAVVGGTLAFYWKILPRDLIAIAKECEKDLPYTQHCEIVVTTKVVDNG